MSLVPLLVNWARDLESSGSSASEWDHSSYFDDDFGFGIHPLELFRSVAPSRLLRRRYSPYEHHRALTRRPGGRSLTGRGIGNGAAELTGAVVPTVGKDGFQVCMDVSQFTPNELTVKTTDRTIIVEGKHEERADDHGLIQRHFVRKYTLPKDYDPKEVVSTVSSDGVLTVKAAPPPGLANKPVERIVQIQQTGPAHLSIKRPDDQIGGDDAEAATGGTAKNGGKQQNSPRKQ